MSYFGHFIFLKAIFVTKLKKVNLKELPNKNTLRIYDSGTPLIPT